jgi:hypothetical protein
MKKNLFRVKFLQHLLGIFLSLFLFVGVGLAQTNPAPHSLTASDYSFTGFSAGTITTYPASMQGWRFASEPTLSNIETVAANGDQALLVSTTSQTTGCIRNEIANGLSLLNSGTNNIGAIVVAVNTNGRKDIKVTWTASELLAQADRQSALCLQYRIGTTGAFTTVSGTTYLASAGASTTLTPPQTFTDIALPAAVENEPEVQIRWLYFNNAGTSGARDRIRLDDITISSTSSGSTPQVEIPTFTPAGGLYFSSQSVTISCNTAGSTIYYTTDNSTPTTSSSIYSTPISVNTSTTIKAMATATGYTVSPIATAVYTIHTVLPNVVISGVYGGGGNNGSTYLNDYIELHNRTNSAIDIAGYTLYYSSAAGTNATAANTFTFPAGASIGAKGFVLIKAAAGAGTQGQPEWPLPFDFDASGAGGTNMQMGATDGKVLLFNAYLNLTTTNSIPNNLAGIFALTGFVDYVPFGTATPKFGTDLTGLAANIAAKRKYNETTQVIAYTFDVGADFDKVTADENAPRNSSYGMPTVATPTFNPPAGVYSTTQNVTISCTTPGVAIYYTTDGTTPTTGSTLYSTSIPVSVTTTIRAIAVLAGMNNSIVASATYTFPIPVANIAAFKAANPATSTIPYVITGDVTYVERLGRNIYIKDATGGLLIFDNATPVITTTYSNGDIISGGVSGTCTIYNGLYELIPISNLAPGTSGAPVLPTVLTMANLLANFNNWESQLVKLEKVTFDEIKTLDLSSTASGANVGISQNGNGMILRNNYNTITGYTTDPTTFFDVAGFIVPFNADRQICPRNLSDITETPSFTITLTPSPTPGGNPTGGGTHYYDDVITVQANPNTGYSFVNWTEGSTLVSTASNYTFTVTSNRDLVANFVLNTYTISVSVNPTGSGTVAGGGTFTHNDPVSLTATANTGYHFVNWTEGGTQVSTANPYNFTATGNRTLVANFALNSYNIAVSANPGVGGTVGGGGSHNHFSTATVTATPNEAYNFINWTEGGVQQSTNQNYSFTVTGPRTLVANFLIKTYNITSSAGTGGTISPVGINSANYGSQPEYVITPNPGYHIQYIYIDGYAISYNIDTESSLPYTYTFDPVYAPHTINVTFAQNCYALNPGNIPGAGGTITMSPAGCVQHGQPVTFTITTDCYQISQILVDNNPVTIQTPYAATYTINNVTGKLPLIVVSTLVDQYTITATPTNDPNGVIIPSGVQHVDCGTDKTFTFETEFGYRVKTLLIDNVSVAVPVTNSYTFKNVKANRTIHVEFEEYPQVIIQFGPSAAQGMGGKVFPTYKPDAVNYIAVDSGTVAYPFSIVPDPGYMIEYVYVDNVINTNAAFTGTYVFQNLHINHSIFATFKPIMLTITATATGNGNLTPNGAVPVQHGANQTFMALPNGGHYLTAIYVDGVYDDVATAAGSYTFNNVTANHTISANFAPNPYIITATHGAYGTITPAGDIDVDHGASQSFYFTPVTGYQVAQVLIDGIENPAAALAGFFTFANITEGHTIHVTFTIKIFTITTTFSPGGNVYPAGIQYVEYNTHSPIFVFNPDPGYIVKQAIIDGVNDPLAVFNGEHRFLNVDANHTIYVVFAKDKYTITASATPGGVINPAGELVIPTGTDKNFYFEPYAGYQLARVIIDGINNPDAVQAGFYTFVDVMNDHSIEAQFEKRMYQVFLPDPNDGAVAVPVGGSDSPVEYGAQFNFVVDPLEGYTQSAFTVRANNIVIHAIGGIYTINNIAVDQYVTVDGLELNTYTITAKANVGGTIKPAGIYQVKHGESKTFEMVPNQGYKVSDVVVNGVSEGDVASYTFHNVKANGTLNAYFKYCEVGIDDTEKGIRVFSHSNVLTIENKDLVPIKQVEVIDMLGSALWRGQADGDKTEITLKIAKGIYMVRVTTEDGRQTVTKVSIY